MTSPPGGRLQTWDPVRPPTTGLSRAECDSREPRLYWGDSPVERGGSQRAPVPSHPSPPLAMDPPRYTLRGGASLSELRAGRGLSISSGFSTSPGVPPVTVVQGAVAAMCLSLR